MRMRFKPYAHDELMAADFHVHEPLIWGGHQLIVGVGFETHSHSL